MCCKLGGQAKQQKRGCGERAKEGRFKRKLEFCERGNVGK